MTKLRNESMDVKSAGGCIEPVQARIDSSGARKTCDHSNERDSSGWRAFRLRVAWAMLHAPADGGSRSDRLANQTESPPLRWTIPGLPAWYILDRHLVRLVFLCAIPAAAGAQLASAALAVPLSAFDSAKAESLLRSRVPCLGCHVVGGTGGRSAPDLTHVASRRSASYIRAMITDPAVALPGTTMPRIPMPASVRELLIAYLSRGAVAGAPIATPPRTPDVTPRDGASLYARNCAACHGERGKGDGPNARYLPIRPAAHADPVTMSVRSDDRLFDAVYGGGYPLGRSAMMPAFGATLTRQEIWQLIRHMRMLCGCAGPAWSRPAPAPAPMTDAPPRSR